MPDKVFWIFYDSLSKTQSNPVTSEQAQMFILKLSADQTERFYVWAPGWKNWQQLRSYLDSEQTFFVSRFSVPTEPKTATDIVKDVLEKTWTQTGYDMLKEDTQAFSSIHLDEETISRIIQQEKEPGVTEYSGEEITWSNIQRPSLDFSGLAKKPLGRRETRHELKIEVILVSPKERLFKSRSKNISLSGTLLEDTIPFDFYSTPFDVLIVNIFAKDPRKSRVKLTAEVVSPNGGLTQRIHFQDPTEFERQALKTLLENYLEQKNKSKAS